ncbi:hypothetical protein D5F01_LYC11109 [Larimichthys crocea]|uniref:Uncharacterized protein n=1 Tax=Larimichthys crocea TaxID=215358 RepID=A0A6G0IJR5_LARCR|nr:hypothetical protein D5F01_LYC11109 [Larimichthys crocea]
MALGPHHLSTAIAVLDTGPPTALDRDADPSPSLAAASPALASGISTAFRSGGRSRKHGSTAASPAPASERLYGFSLWRLEQETLQHGFTCAGLSLCWLPGALPSGFSRWWSKPKARQRSWLHLHRPAVSLRPPALVIARRYPRGRLMASVVALPRDQNNRDRARWRPLQRDGGS